MKKLDFWQADWFLGVVVALIVLAFSGRDLAQRLSAPRLAAGAAPAASA